MWSRLPHGASEHVTLVGWWIGALATQLGSLLVHHPDWILATHEDLCEAAESRFGDLYHRLGLTWTPETGTRISARGGYIEPLVSRRRETCTLQPSSR